MHILIAPNAFKNSLTATQAANAIHAGILQSRLQCTSELCPVGDGGDGTGQLIVDRLQGERIMVTVSDPLGLPVTAPLGWIDEEKIAIIEMADASGLRLLSPEELDPMRASTSGTGEMIRLALDKGARQIILCVGGSATCDGGAGILQALGCRFLDAGGEMIPAYPASLTRLARVDPSLLDSRLKDVQLTILCDVTNPLLGPTGTAAVFSPQKGAGPAQVQQLEEILTRLNALTILETGIDMSQLEFGGAAGGVAAGLHAYLSANLTPGIDYFLDITGFDRALKKADWVITGEGSIDEQTLAGKAPMGVARRAMKRSVPVITLGGNIPEKPSEELQKFFPILFSICRGPVDLETAIKTSGSNLTRTAATIGNFLVAENVASGRRHKKPD